MPSALARHWTHDPDVTYLNHGAFGSCPAPVLAAQARERARLEAEPVLYLARELEGRLDRARAALARFVGADPQDLVFVPNATSGVNTVLRSLRFAPGDEIVVTSHGYNACTNAARFVAEHSGARVVVAQVPFPIQSPTQVLEAIRAVAGPKTKLALVDHVTSPTGLVFPIAEIVAELEGRGIPVLVDGAHAPGMVPLEIEKLGASYYTGNCHKWLCAPKTAAFLHVRRELQPGIHPLVISHGASSARDDRSLFHLKFDWPGTFDPTVVLVLPELLAFMETLVPGGWAGLMARNHALALEGRAALLEVLDIPAPAPDEMIGTLVALPLPDNTAGTRVGPLGLDPIHVALFEKFRIEVPVFPFPAPPKRLLRISAQAYNAPEDYAKLAQALRTLL